VIRVEGVESLDISIKTADPLKVLDLDLAMDALAQENPHLAHVLELRYFGGLTADETAEVTGRTVHSVRHDLRFAYAWLRRRLAGETQISSSVSTGR
jgi:DNA-directed RNA polymerase specialized sigma24 family protein